MINTIINSFDTWTDAQGIKSRIRVNSVENISLEGIARLRELILELAVLGKLVPQDASDEQASVLLKKKPSPIKNKPVIKKTKKPLCVSGKKKKVPKREKNKTKKKTIFYPMWLKKNTLKIKTKKKKQK